MSDTTAAGPNAPTSVPTITQTTKPIRPYWLPDTQGFLAVAIITIIAIMAFMLLTGSPKFDDKVAGAFMTLLGVLTACLKDVYSYFFGSSKGEEKKGDVISTIAQTAPPPVTPPTSPIDAVGQTMFTNGVLAYFLGLPTEDEKRRFILMTPEERLAAVGKT